MIELTLAGVIVVSILAVLDVASACEGELRSFTRRHWVRASFVPVLGPLLWVVYGRPRAVRAPSAPSRYILQNTATDDNAAYIEYLGRLIEARRHQAQD
ncbi:MAG TPA: hypothetical protein VFK68_01580 [Propionibacteriaceae bacterium]|nr:hypothetical protein [Propionibacteriaceae bacterium]